MKYTGNYKWMKLKMYTNGKKSCFHKLEDLVLRLQYFPKWSTDWIQSITKLQLPFSRKRQAKPNNHMDLQGTQNSWNNWEKNNKVGKTDTSQFQNIAQKYSNQNSVVNGLRLDIYTNGTKVKAQKQTHLLWAIDFNDSTEIIQWNRIIFSANGARTTSYIQAKE